MSLVHDLYPHHRPPAGTPMPGRHDPASLVVCLPPAAGRHIVDLVGELVDRLRPHVATPAGLLDAAHFVLWHRLDATEAKLLVLPTPDPDLPELRGGWPADRAAHRPRAHAAATRRRSPMTS
jgi:hypothetical protein